MEMGGHVLTSFEEEMRRLRVVVMPIKIKVVTLYEYLHIVHIGIHCIIDFTSTCVRAVKNCFPDHFSLRSARVEMHRTLSAFKKAKSYVSCIEIVLANKTNN